MPLRARLRLALGTLAFLAGCSSTDGDSGPSADAASDVDAAALVDAKEASSADCVPDADCSACGTCAAWCACLVGEAGLGACVDNCYGSPDAGVVDGAADTGGQ